MADCRKCKSAALCKKIGIRTKEKAISYCTGFNEIGVTRYPKIFIKDEINNRIFQFGESKHDALMIDDRGRLQYLNLQCGMGSGCKERICEDGRSLKYPYRFVRYDEQDKEEVTDAYLHKRGLDKYICAYEWWCGNIYHKEDNIEFETAEQRLEYYTALKEECENQIRLAQIEIDRGER